VHRMALAGVLALAGVAVVARGGVAATTPVLGVTTTTLAKSTLAQPDNNARTSYANTGGALLMSRAASDGDVVDDTFAVSSDTPASTPTRTQSRPRDHRRRDQLHQ
jgi:hypothetical protein